MKKEITVRRAGGRWEFIGFVLIVVGVISKIQGVGDVWFLPFAIGCVVFLVGRFK